MLGFIVKALSGIPAPRSEFVRLLRQLAAQWFVRGLYKRKAPVRDIERLSAAVAALTGRDKDPPAG